jgi:hypothetical protein
MREIRFRGLASGMFEQRRTRARGAPQGLNGKVLVLIVLVTTTAFLEARKSHNAATR